MGDRGRARQPRLGIVDVYDLDRQRQLILLRRDNVEHLLLVGGPNDVVVETNIVRVAGARLPAVQADTERAEAARVAEPSFDPVLGATIGSEALKTGPSRRSAGLEPVLKPTRVTAAPAPNGGMPAPPPRLLPGRPDPEPQAGEQNSLDMARQLEAALRQPPAQPVERPRPQPTPEPRRPDPVPRQEPSRADPDRVEPVRAEPPRQRPPEPLRPAPPAPPPPAPPPARPEPVSAPAPAPKPPVPAPKPVAAPPAAPPQPAPPQAPTPAPAPIPTPPPAPAPPAKPDPFSIEDIEAEFARLLGRPLDKKD